MSKRMIAPRKEDQKALLRYPKEVKFMNDIAESHGTLINRIFHPQKSVIRMYNAYKIEI
ncbi:MAG: hypothetical protein IJJ77_00315 [Paludibacteraceae bacterium]|nr:hypothetical protein [Paludibacteraceae bacterium]